MKKNNKLRVLCLLIIVFSLGLPLFMTSLQDFNDINKEVELEDNQTEAILKNHPVIESIYKLRQRKTDKSEEYVIKRKDEYDEKKQEKFIKIQSLFSKEIQKMIGYKIMSHEMLENDDQVYIADYGTITYYEEVYYLDQILRMWEDSFKSFGYEMDPVTHKIIEFSMSQEKSIQLSDEEIKKMVWSMIEYLELDDIEDWAYNQYGYESNQAKLRIACDIEKRVDTDTVRISVDLLGALTPLQYKNLAR
ncbi:hypothetical protein [Candidatus Stoquefichus massiliensis]|uniref:hypothetical protein n=1 Tax=Candidatus Stoquefichus massiliensis TaxID=1470350 RepID=UPI0004B28815|nr:hypothetical protein [Candidatus Stoquefichus massiliensis]